MIRILPSPVLFFYSYYFFLFSVFYASFFSSFDCHYRNSFIVWHSHFFFVYNQMLLLFRGLSYYFRHLHNEFSAEKSHRNVHTTKIQITELLWTCKSISYMHLFLVRLMENEHKNYTLDLSIHIMEFNEWPYQKWKKKTTTRNRWNFCGLWTDRS